MKCPECNYRMRVIDTRLNDHGVRRVRECGRCQQRYTTYEAIHGPAVHGGDRRSEKHLGETA